MILSIADLLETHVRFEEQELFPVIEDLIPEEDLLPCLYRSPRRVIRRLDQARSGTITVSTLATL
jgi:hypothetical protein